MHSHVSAVSDRELMTPGCHQLMAPVFVKICHCLCSNQSDRKGIYKETYLELTENETLRRIIFKEHDSLRIFMLVK